MFKVHVNNNTVSTVVISPYCVTWNVCHTSLIAAGMLNIAVIHFTATCVTTI